MEGWKDVLYDLAMDASSRRIDATDRCVSMLAYHGSTCIASRCKHWDMNQQTYVERIPNGNDPTTIAYRIVCIHKRDGFEAHGRSMIKENARMAMQIWALVSEGSLNQENMRDLYVRLSKLKVDEELILFETARRWEKKLFQSEGKNIEKEEKDDRFEGYVEKHGISGLLPTDPSFIEWMQTVHEERAIRYVRGLRCMGLLTPHLSFALSMGKERKPSWNLHREAFSKHLVEELCTRSEIHIRVFQKAFDNLRLQGINHEGVQSIKGLTIELEKVRVQTREGLLLLAEDLHQIASILPPRFMGRAALGMWSVLTIARAKGMCDALRSRSASFLDAMASKDLKAALKVYFCICTAWQAQNVLSATYKILSCARAGTPLPWHDVLPYELGQRNTSEQRGIEGNKASSQK